MRCKIKNCGNSFESGRSDQPSYFSFPRDPKVLKQWLALCENPSNFKPRTWRVCSDHFKREEMTGLLQCSLGVKRKISVDKSAIPSLLPKDEEQTERENRIQVRERKKLVSKLLAESEPSERKELKKIESVMLSESQDGYKYVDFTEETQEFSEPCDEETNFSKGDTMSDLENAQETEPRLEEPESYGYLVKEEERCTESIVNSSNKNPAFQITKKENGIDSISSEIPWVEENNFSNCDSQEPFEIDLLKELKESKIENIHLKRKIFELQEQLKKKDFEVEVYKKCLVKLGNKRR